MRTGLKKGDKLIAQWSENFADHVTKGKEYEVTGVTNAGFYIINDLGEKCFPISTRFKKVYDGTHSNH